MVIFHGLGAAVSLNDELAILRPIALAAFNEKGEEAGTIKRVSAGFGAGAGGAGGQCGAPGGKLVSHANE